MATPYEFVTNQLCNSLLSASVEPFIDAYKLHRRDQMARLYRSGVDGEFGNDYSKFGGGLSRDGILVVLVNANFDSGGVHRQQFAKRTGFADQYAATLAQGVIQGFDNIGLAFALGTGPVWTRRQCLGIGRK